MSVNGNGHGSAADEAACVHEDATFRELAADFDVADLRDSLTDPDQIRALDHLCVRALGAEVMLLEFRQRLLTHLNAHEEDTDGSA